MNWSLIKTLTFVLMFGVLVLSGAAQETKFDEGKLYVWVKRDYDSWENPLHTEFIMNGETVNIFTSDTFEPVQQYIKPGWNDVTIKTTPQEPAENANSLIFRIGPMFKDPKDSTRFVMNPVLWEFRNDTDWKLKDGQYSHPLGPDVQDVTLSYRLYWAGLEHENAKLNAGDYVLQAKSDYGGWNTPVGAMVFVNGVALNSFLLGDRQIVITSLLKPGKNEIKLVSSRVKNSLTNNDIKLSVGGPAEWYADKNQYMLKPVNEFTAGQGWIKEAKTGQLITSADANADTIERTIAFMIKAPSPTAPAAE
ncbi:MAG: hypothetical protein SGI88_13480 [Candidatus Hydrogenedentes bacterium]|nr:hypothetical protein [Candidatus Hydrogenedentota bacterium]